MKKKNLITRSVCYDILYWCISEFGRSKLNGRYPHIELRKGDYYTGEDALGYFDEIESSIFINKDLNKTLEELVKTILHEYCHYCYHSMLEYKILSKYLSHHRNPLEIEARRFEIKHYKRCLTYLKKECGIYE